MIEPMGWIMLSIIALCVRASRREEKVHDAMIEHGIPIPMAGGRDRVPCTGRIYLRPRWMLDHCSPELQKKLRGRIPTPEQVDYYNRLAEEKVGLRKRK